LESPSVLLSNKPSWERSCELVSTIQPFVPSSLLSLLLASLFSDQLTSLFLPLSGHLLHHPLKSLPLHPPTLRERARPPSLRALPPSNLPLHGRHRSCCYRCCLSCRGAPFGRDGGSSWRWEEGEGRRGGQHRRRGGERRIARGGRESRLIFFSLQRCTFLHFP